jgi:hypothetical protein
LWDKKFGHPSRLQNFLEVCDLPTCRVATNSVFLQRFQKYYRNKHHTLKKRNIDDADSSAGAAQMVNKKRSRAPSAINLFAKAHEAEISSESKLRTESRKSALSRWQDIRNEKWSALLEEEKAVWFQEAEERKGKRWSSVQQRPPRMTS